MEKKNYLPIGSIVLLKDGKKTADDLRKKAICKE